MRQCFVQAATTTSLFVLAAGACSEGDRTADPNPAATGRTTTYLIPLEFDPEPGVRDVERSVQIIDSPEFSVMITGEMIAANVPGFEPAHLGRKHDTMVIVRNFTDEFVRNWEPTEALNRNWNEIWRMEGSMAQACVDEEPDPLTGLIRYTTLCNPDPAPNSSFYLMDRRPSPEHERPGSQDYIKATCSEKTSFRLPDAGRFYRCIHTRRTSWGDQFSFRLYGKNIALMNEVEAYLQSLFESWRADPVSTDESRLQ